MKSPAPYEFPASSTISEKLASKLDHKDYRHEYMVEGVKTWIARQARALREQRGWSQSDVARESGKKQSAISRIEDPDYGKLSLQTLFDLASTFDLPLLVQFTGWKDWLDRMEDVSVEALQKDGFAKDEITNFATRQFIPTRGEPSSGFYRNLMQIVTTVNRHAMNIGCPVLSSRAWKFPDNGSVEANNMSFQKIIAPLSGGQYVVVDWPENASVAVDEDSEKDFLEMPEVRAVQSLERRHG